MNQITYVYFCVAAIPFVVALLIRFEQGDPNTISWGLWGVGALAYLAAIFWFGRRLQRKLFGESIVVDPARFVPPNLCPSCGQQGENLRAVHFHGTQAGPVPFVQMAQLPVLLCSACAGKYDNHLVKTIKGLRIGRVGYNSLTIQIKRPDYLAAVLSANQSNATS